MSETTSSEVFFLYVYGYVDGLGVWAGDHATHPVCIGLVGLDGVLKV